MPTYIRVRDDSTGYEYDVEDRFVRYGMTPIDDYPSNSGPGARPRPAKHHVAKDGKAAPRRQRKPAPVETEPTTPQIEGAQPS